MSHKGTYNIIIFNKSKLSAVCLSVLLTPAQKKRLQGESTSLSNQNISTAFYCIQILYRQNDWREDRN